MISCIAAILGFLGVGLGAFGAHGLKEILNSQGTVAIWEKAVLYHFVHVLALLATAGRIKPITAYLWIAGILIFSGSLYILAFTGIKWLGAITPIGGLCLMAGWVMLAFQKIRD